MRPNVLFVMADQMAAWALPIHGGPAKMPHLAALAARGTIFDAASCNSPICAPSRFSMLAGRLPGAIGAWDNASELPASVPTLAHALSAAGMRTILAGKMHFIGPDQLHGYAERLTTDIYPADFAWTPDWTAGPRDKPSGISMKNVLQAGPCVRSLQMDYDDEVEHLALQRLYDLAREPAESRKPFFLTVSFSQPHPPFTAGHAHWDRYRDDEVPPPRVPPIPFDDRDAHSRWLHLSHDADRDVPTPEQLHAARRAYLAMCSAIDDKLGRLLATLAECGFADDTAVVVTADHGEMLGERGMYYKQSFFEASVRVPLVVALPGQAEARRVRDAVSLVDLLPTLVELAGGGVDWPEPLDGASLVPLLHGEAMAPRPAIAEYADMGVVAPCRMVRDGDWKLMHTHGHPDRLHDLASDPLELDDRIDDPSCAAVRERLRALLHAGWDGEAVLADVLASQKRRRFLKAAAAASGTPPDWTFQATRDDRKRFVRATGAAGAKARARFPFVE